MKELSLQILTSYYTWIAVELIAIGILVFFVSKLSRKKKMRIEELSRQTEAHQFRELDEMLVNRKRGER